MNQQTELRYRRVLDETFDAIEPIAEQAGSCFYGRLFDQAPHVLPLFRRNLSEPALAPAAAHRFVQLLTITIAAFDDSIAADRQGNGTVDRLADRHVGYRVEPEHYEPMRAALLWALEVQLDDAFTAEHRAAWGEAYDRLADRMIAVHHAAHAAHVAHGAAAH